MGGGAAAALTPSPLGPALVDPPAGEVARCPRCDAAVLRFRSPATGKETLLETEIVRADYVGTGERVTIMLADGRGVRVLRHPTGGLLGRRSHNCEEGR